MDAVELLIQDHQVVRGLFQRFQAAQEEGDTAAMAAVVDEVFTELRTHTTIEEEIFYPAVRDGVDGADEQVDEGLQEHHVVEVLMEEMEGLDAGSDDWVAKMTVLIENVEHHAEEEEQDMFPDVREQLGDERLEELADALEERRQAAKDGSSGDGNDECVTKDELYRRARDEGIEGRSDMTKDELAEALDASS